MVIWAQLLMTYCTANHSGSCILGVTRRALQPGHVEQTPSVNVKGCQNQHGVLAGSCRVLRANDLSGTYLSFDRQLHPDPSFAPFYPVLHANRTPPGLGDMSDPPGLGDMSKPSRAVHGWGPEASRRSGAKVGVSE